MAAALPVLGCDRVLGAEFDDAQSVRVTIELTENPLEPQATGSGVIRVDDRAYSCDPACDVEVSPNSVTLLTAVADPDSAFHSWRPAETCSPAGSNVCALSVGAADVAVEGTFVKNVTNLWARSIGSSELMDASRVTADAEGNVIVVGAFSGETSLGPVTHSSRGEDDSFVLKLDPLGRELASVSFGTAKGDRAYALATMADGGVVVGGSIGDTTGEALPIFVGDEQVGNTAPTGGDALLVSLDPLLAVRGVWQVSGTGGQAVVGISITSGGEIHAIARIAGVFDLGDGTLLAAEDNDIGIARLDRDARMLSASLVGGIDTQIATTVVADTAGGFHLGGAFHASADLGGSCAPLSAPPEFEYVGFVAHFDSEARCTDARRIAEGAERATVDRMAVDSAGHVYVAGGFQGNVDFSLGADPKGVLPLQDPVQSYVVKLGPKLEWVVGTSFAVRVDEVPSVAADSTGNVLVTGDAPPIVADVPQYFTDIIVRKLDAAGNEVVKRRFGGRSSETPFATAWDAATGAWLVVGTHGDGLFEDPIDFGGVAENPLFFDGAPNALVAKFSP